MRVTYDLYEAITLNLMRLQNNNFPILVVNIP